MNLRLSPILAKRGAGKTYTALVLVEELLGAGAQVVVADPVGVWWGPRAAANGKDPGLPIVVMGGDHGDVPLEASAGRSSPSSSSTRAPRSCSTWRCSARASRFGS